MNAHKTQRQRILNLLRNANGGWVASYLLSQVALQYTARIKELRKLGFVIENRIQHVDGQVHGSYKLVMEVSSAASKAVPNINPKPKPQQAEPSLFGDISPLPD